MDILSHAQSENRRGVAPSTFARRLTPAGLQALARAADTAGTAKFRNAATREAGRRA